MIESENSIKLSASNAAKYLGLSSNLLAVWRFRKVYLSFEKIGKSIKYDIAVLKIFKESCRREI